MKKLLLASIMLVATFSQTYAVEFTINNISCGTVGPTECARLDKELDDLVRADLPEVSVGDYGTGLANANGFAQKGLGSDYSDMFTYAMVRGGVGAAVDGEIDKPESADGFGFGAALTVGINLDLLPIDKIGPVDLSKMDLFISFMNYDVDQEDDSFTAKGDFSSLSIMARYHIMEGKDIFPGYMLEWGGVFVHTGIQRSSFSANLSSIFDDESVDIGGGNTATFADANATFDLKTTTTTIPFEVSTYLRTVWALTFYTGAGFDLVSGKTDISLDATGMANGSVATGGYQSELTASESDSGNADATNFRAFFGTQLNLPFFRIYAHANKGLGNNLIGVNLGAKILW